MIYDTNKTTQGYEKLYRGKVDTTVKNNKLYYYLKLYVSLTDTSLVSFGLCLVLADVSVCLVVLLVATSGQQHWLR